METPTLIKEIIMAQPSYRHRIVIEVVFDRPVLQNEAVRIVRPTLVSTSYHSPRKDRQFAIDAVKSFTRVSANPGKE